MEHFETGPSSADIWSRCKAYLQIKRNCPTDEDNVLADEGTAAHHFSEMAIRDATFDVLNYVGFKHEPTGIVCDVEMATYCNVYVGRVKQLIDMCLEMEVMVDYRSEYRVDLSFIYPGFFGTRDFHIIAVFSNWAVVIDLKFGRVLVPAKDNRQLIGYALDIINQHPNVEYVRFEIVQPRGYASWGDIDTADYTREQLQQYIPLFAEYQAANHSDEIQTPTPGDHCRYCDGNGRCRPNMEYMLNLAGAPVKFNPHLLTAEEVEKVIRQSKSIDRFLKGAYQYGRQLALQGAPFRELKMVKVKSKAQPVKESPSDIAKKITMLTGKVPDMDKLAPRKLGPLSAIRAEYGDAVADLFTAEKTETLELRGLEESGTPEQSKMMTALNQPIAQLEQK